MGKTCSKLTVTHHFALNLQRMKKTTNTNDLCMSRMVLGSILERQSIYEGQSNENFKSAIKSRNTARLSCKLTKMIFMV